MERVQSRIVEIFLNRTFLDGVLSIPLQARGIVLFFYHTKNLRFNDPHSCLIQQLHFHRIGTLSFDLLTTREEQDGESRFNLDLLTHRLTDTTDWISGELEAKNLPLGYFGADLNASIAFHGAALLGDKIRALVSRGGLPNLLGVDIEKITSPTLLIVGEKDRDMIAFNRVLLQKLTCIKKLEIIPGSVHVHEREEISSGITSLTVDWFIRHFDFSQEHSLLVS